MSAEEKKQAYAYNEVERGFSFAKRCCGLVVITTKLHPCHRK